MSARPTVTETTDPTQARRWFGPLVDERPVEMSVVASVTANLLLRPGRYEDPRWWALRHGDDTGRVVAAAVHTPPQPLRIGFADAPGVVALVDHLVAAGREVPGVGGEVSVVDAFVRAWCPRTGTLARTTMRSDVFELPDRPRMPFEVRGGLRWAGADDLAMAQGWADDFHEEALGGTGRAADVRVHVDSGRLGLWEVDHRAVAMTWASAPAGGVSRLSWVYTPPEHRGRGFASAVVAAVSDACVALGERCMLYTDLANPTSNAIYQALGYRRVGDNLTVAFDPAR